MASCLLTGASFISILQGTDDSSTSSDKIPPLLLTELGETSEEANKKPTAKASSALESDEEMARRLAKECGIGAENSPAIASAAAVRSSPMEMDPILSDEELTQRLQAEWDSELTGISSVDGVSVSSVFAMDGSSTHSIAAESGTMSELSPQKNLVVIDGMDNARPHWQHVLNE
jgi:hypothetical protein